MAMMPCWLRQSVRDGSSRKLVSSVRVMPWGMLRVAQPEVRRIRVVPPPRLLVLISLLVTASSVRKETLVPAGIDCEDRVARAQVWVAVFQV